MINCNNATTFKKERSIDPRTARAKERYEGQHFFTTDGQQEYVIEEYKAANNIIVHYLGTDIREKKQHSQIFGKGLVNPFPDNAGLRFTDPYKKWMNTYFHTNQGYLIKVIDYKGTSNVTIQFQDEFGYITTTTAQNILNGEIYNPYRRNSHGGYIGAGPFCGNAIGLPSRLYSLIYNIWNNMIERVDENSSYRKSHNTKSYDGCCVVEPWYCFNNFAQWYYAKLMVLNPNYTYDLDKDLKYFMYKANTDRRKCYGPNYCVLVPHDLNLAISGIINHGTTEDKIILTLANKYLADNAITLDTYNIILQAMEYYRE